MIALDTNILIYAHRAESVFHKRASEILSNLCEGIADWSIPWICMYEFYAVVTNPKIFRHQNMTPPDSAASQIAAWLLSPTLVMLSESEETWDLTRRLIDKHRPLGANIHDARIFAICESYGVKTLWTADRDFSKFGGRLSIQNPL
jgi:toxin-antitoxin system PIN domain toxin